jgi:hypothetical protein
MRKKSDRKKLDEKALKIWAACIKTRDRKCQVPGCNSEYKLSAHHISPRQYKITRFLLANGITLCAGHHMLQKFDAEKFRAIIVSIVGLEKYDYLYGLAWNNGSPHKVTIADLEFEIESLTRELKRLESDWGKIGVNY